MDGSARPFMDALAPAVARTKTHSAFAILRPVVVRRGDAFAAFLPFDGRRFDVEINFKDRAIGEQRVTHDLTADFFRTEIAPARTFGRLKDVHKLRRRGYARGATFDNAVAVDGNRIVNPEGLRFPDEFARHKLLDAVGDVALAGRPVMGLYRGYKAGHRLNYELLAAAFSDDENFRSVT